MGGDSPRGGGGGWGSVCALTYTSHEHTHIMGGYCSIERNNIIVKLCLKLPQTFIKLIKTVIHLLKHVNTYIMGVKSTYICNAVILPIIESSDMYNILPSEYSVLKY